MASEPGAGFPVEEPAPPFTYEEWLTAWQSVAERDATGQTMTECAEAWNVSISCARQRMHRLLKAGKVRCTWGYRTAINGVRIKTTIYVLTREAVV